MKVITVGRKPGNNIIVNDVCVSRTHLQLVQNDNGECSVVDLNSVNGTFVNEKKIVGEVRLQPQDVIRIGNTILPWQEYLSPIDVDEQKTAYNIDSTSSNKKSRIWWYAVACGIFVLLAGGLGFYYYYTIKDKEEIEAPTLAQEEVRMDQLRKDAAQKAEEAQRLQEEADELYRIALNSQSDKSKALAEAKQKEATEAKKKAEAALAAQRKAESDKLAAQKAKDELVITKEAAENNMNNPIQNAQKASLDIKPEDTEERDSAKKEKELKERFNEKFAVMDEDCAQKVCRQLGYYLPNGADDAKTQLQKSFNQTNYKGKQAIVKAIENVTPN